MPRLRQHEGQVDQQPDREEEHHQQQALDRVHRAHHQRALGGVADVEAGEEGAEPGRQLERAAQRGADHAERQRADRREVADSAPREPERQVDALAPADSTQISPRAAATASASLSSRPARSMPLALARPTDDDQHRHDGKVLGDQHADREPPGLGAQLADVLEDA